MEDTDFKEHYIFQKKLELKLRNVIQQKDTALVELNIVCDGEKRTNQKLIDQLMACQKRVQSLTHDLKRAVRMDKQECLEQIQQLEDDNDKLMKIISEKDQEIKKILQHPIYKAIINNPDDLNISMEQQFMQEVQRLTSIENNLKKQLNEKQEELEQVSHRLRSFLDEKVGDRFEKDTQVYKQQMEYLRIKDDMKGYVSKVFELENQNQMLIRENHNLLQKMNSDNLQKTEQQQLKDQYNNNIFKDISERARATLNTEPNFSQFNQL